MSHDGFGLSRSELPEVRASHLPRRGGPVLRGSSWAMGPCGAALREEGPSRNPVYVKAVCLEGPRSLGKNRHQRLTLLLILSGWVKGGSGESLPPDKSNFLPYGSASCQL